MEIRAEMVANVWQVRTEVGKAVAEGDELVVLESMKMEIPVVAPAAGTVTAIHVEPDQVVQEGDLIAEIESCIRYFSPSRLRRPSRSFPRHRDLRTRSAPARRSRRWRTWPAVRARGTGR